MAKTKKSTEVSKLFVLDTNVLLHDPTCIFRFKEHDVFIPLITLEELDAHKKGLTEVARNARQASRYLDEILNHVAGGIDKGIALSVLGNKDATGKLTLQTQIMGSELPESLPGIKADNQILSIVMALKADDPRTVVLVSKDINIRIKAKALGLDAEDYFNDKVLEDSDLLYTGQLELDAKFWIRNGADLKSWQENGRSYYKIQGPDVPNLHLNEFLWSEDEGNPFFARVLSLEPDGKTAVLETLKDYTHQKNSVWGICARNKGQNFALNLLMDPNIDFVTLMGQAGTGKTLLTLAAGLEMTLDKKMFTEIIMTRVTIPVGEDIGFLPGTEEEKMAPWMGALEDNLEVLSKIEDGNEWGRSATQDVIRSRIKIKSLNFMRGRTFQNKLLIIDEAQNLTPKQMKTLITRAGTGTKVICLGNISQIDTPYLTEGSSGITYVVDRFKGWEHSGHITLQRGERSRLADYAIEIL